MNLNKKFIQRLRRLKTGDISDGLAALRIRGRVSDQRLVRIVNGPTLVGTAVTSRWFFGPDDGGAYVDEAALLYGLGRSVPKAVLMQRNDIPGFVSMGSGGGRVLKSEGFVGSITHGLIRDTQELRELKWPCWAFGITPQTILLDEAPAGQRIKIEFNKKVEVAGAEVEPGDIIVADADGFCAIPSEHLLDVIREAEKVVKTENRIFAMLDKGLSFKQVLETDQALRQVGTAQRHGSEFSGSGVQG